MDNDHTLRRLPNRRTAPALVETAVRDCQDAGRGVVGTEVHGGGFVRVYFSDPQTVGQQVKAANTCDDASARYQIETS